MVRNGLGVDARGGRVRATCATASRTLVVVEDAPFLDVGEALRVALSSARAKFGEPEAIALVHDDDLDDATREGMLRDAQGAGIGEVRLVRESVARPFAEHEDVPPALVAATGAAIWLLRERRAVVVPPPLLPSGEEETGRRMDDFGRGRQMSDFGAGSSMSDHGDGRRMEDFGGGRTMADFGAGAVMADFGSDESPPRRRSRLVVAAIAVAVAIVAGAGAAVGLSGRGSDANRVAATEGSGTTADERDDARTTTTESLEPGSPPTTSVGGATEETTSTTSTTATAPTAGGSTQPSTSTPAAATTTTTVVSTTTRRYSIDAMVESYAYDGQTPRLQPGQRAAGIVTMTCPDDGSGRCTGSIDIPDFGYSIAGFPAQSVGNRVDYSAADAVPACTDGSTVTMTFSADFTNTDTSGSTSQTHKPGRTCTGADGKPVFLEDLTISFFTIQSPG